MEPLEPPLNPPLVWLLAGPVKCNWPSVTLWSVFQYPVTYKKVKNCYENYLKLPFCLRNPLTKL